MISKSQIHKIAKDTKVQQYLSYREYLKDIFDGIQNIDPSYIFKDFAELMGYARENNTIRLIINGTRVLSNKKSGSVAHTLGLDSKSRKYFVTLVDFNNEKQPSIRDELFQELLTLRKKSTDTKLTEDQLEYFSEWYNPVIRELMALSNLATDPESIQNHLMFNIRLGEIKKSIELLDRIGAIKFDKKNLRYRPSRGIIETEQDLNDMSIIGYHQKMIEMGKESITQVPPEERSVTGLTLCIPEEAIPKMKEKIDKLLEEFLEFESDGKSSRIYQVNVQLFPFSKKGSAS